MEYRLYTVLRTGWTRDYLVYADLLSRLDRIYRFVYAHENLVAKFVVAIFCEVVGAKSDFVNWSLIVLYSVCEEVFISVFRLYCHQPQILALSCFMDLFLFFMINQFLSDHLLVYAECRSSEICCP